MDAGIKSKENSQFWYKIVVPFNKLRQSASQSLSRIIAEYLHRRKDAIFSLFFCLSVCPLDYSKGWTDFDKKILGVSVAQRTVD